MAYFAIMGHNVWDNIQVYHFANGLVVTFKPLVSIKNLLPKVSVFLFEGHWHVCRNTKLHFPFYPYIFLKTLICYVSMPISGKYQIYTSHLWFDEINMYKIFYS